LKNKKLDVFFRDTVYIRDGWTIELTVDVVVVAVSVDVPRRDAHVF